MRQVAKKSKVTRQPQSEMVFRVVPLPPPIGGWNRREALPLMEDTDAVVLDNFIPDTTALKLRGGYSTHATVEGTATAIESLIPYPAMNGSNAQLFAATPSAIYDVTTATPSVVNDSYTKVLLHFNGIGTPSTIVDSNFGGSAHTWTAAGDAINSASAEKFGAGGLLCDGIGDWITTPDHADFTLGSSDFTVDFWFNCTAATGTDAYIAGQSDNGAALSSTSFYILRLATNNIRACVAYGPASAAFIDGTTQFTNALNTGWHHVALVRYGDVATLYIDGVSEGSAALPGTVNNSTNLLGVGVIGEIGAGGWTGSIDEFRISVGIARWTANFTPPTSQYSASESVFTGLSNGRWNHDYMVNTSGLYTVAANGADVPLTYDGTTWATCSVSASGLTRTNLIAVHNHMNRLWFLEENQLHVWYLATSAIQGTLTKFLPPFRRGGKLMAMGSWTRDGGSGSDDFSVFVSNKGECVIYAGVDPTSASSFALVGVYNIPNVIGRRCLVPAGAELGILTMQGCVPLSQIMGMTPGAAARTSISDKISGQFKGQFFSTGTQFGWEAIEYPRGNLLIINVPISERTTQHQYVMNELTGAWCRFTGINVGCWGLHNNDLYAGTNSGTVIKYDTQQMDDTSNIIGTVQHAYNAFGNPQSKRFTMARPIFNAPTVYNPPVTVLVDYDLSVPATTVLIASVAGTQWDAAQWDTFQWAGGSITTQGWQGTTGEGRAASVAFSVSSSEAIFYNGTDVGFERGHRI